MYTYTYHEMKILVEGEMDIEDETGQKVHAVPGDVFWFPKGAKITFTTESYGLAFFVSRGWGFFSCHTREERGRLVGVVREGEVGWLTLGRWARLERGRGMGHRVDGRVWRSGVKGMIGKHGERARVRVGWVMSRNMKNDATCVYGV